MKRYWVILTLSLVLYLAAAPLFGIAQDSVNLKSVSVSLWPEFDRPSVLTIYEIVLSPETILPQSLSFQIPAEAQLQTIAIEDTFQRWTTVHNDVRQSGSWQDISFLTTSHRIRLEYLDPTLVKQADLRRFDFTWLSIYPVEELSFFVQQPYGASDLVTDPLLSQKDDADLRRPYYTADFGPVQAGELFSLKLQYIKDTADLTYPALDVFPASEIDELTRGRTASPLSVVMWLIAVAVMVLIFVGIYYLWFRNRIVNKPTLEATGVGFLNPEKQTAFCHECGMRSRLGDNFCRNCGTELRRIT